MATVAVKKKAASPASSSPEDDVKKFKLENFTTYASHLSRSRLSSSIPAYKYDVFLSFRGEDTRNNFTNHLQAALNRNQIETFKDDEKLPRGEVISEELLKSIEDSRFSLVVLSENYAQSRWCLDELAHILECSLKPAAGRSVFPIFYRVDPSDVRNQTGSYAKAFSEHEAAYKDDGDKVKRWRCALTDVANRSGWHVHNGPEDEYIQQIANVVSSKLLESDISSSGGGGSSTDQSQSHDVFISYEGGDDTYTRFTNHLYKTLYHNGVATFKDHKQRDATGRDMSPKLQQAIRDSIISLVVLSPNYGASSSCLDELVHILECKREYRNKVFPIFYHISPLELLDQTIYKQGFGGEHEQNDEQKVAKWRSALRKAADMFNFHVYYRSDEDFIAEIVDEVLRQLHKRDKWGTTADFSGKISYENMVGIDSRVKEIIEYLNPHVLKKYARIVGIWGVQGGIGMTTIARAVYDKISDQFDVCCFVANVSQESERVGLDALQLKLVEHLAGTRNIFIRNADAAIKWISDFFCGRKVLLILDDVLDDEQFEALAGDTDLFGPGSVVIITSRDLRFLQSTTKDPFVYKFLNNDESRQLLCLNAFKQNTPVAGYEEMCNRLVVCVGGNPLVIRIVGRFLRHRSIDQWELGMDMVQPQDIDRWGNYLPLLIVLKSLDKEVPDVFLHIACFFNGKEVNQVLQVLECTCGPHSRIGMSILIEMSLVTISNNIIRVPDRLRAMGREIVRQEDRREPGNRSRLWNHNQVSHVFSRHSGTPSVKAIVLHPDPEDEGEYDWPPDAFDYLDSLKLLSINCPVELRQGLAYLPNSLRFFEWDRYPLSYFPLDFYPKWLVELKIRSSSITRLWRERMFRYLKSIDVSFSRYLVETPNFDDVPNLESLVLQGCSGLRFIHKSIGFLTKLRLLNLKDCFSVESLPDLISMESLEICILSGCTGLHCFPYKVGNVERLSQLYLDGTRTEDADPKSHHNLWNFLSQIPYLVKLSMRNCKLHTAIPMRDVDFLTSLEVLDFSKNMFESVCLPRSIRQLAKLKFLGIACCRQLLRVPNLPSNIEYVEARDCSSLEKFPDPTDGTINSKELVLSLVNCDELIKQDKNKCFIVTWLKTYFRSQLSNQKQELSNLSGRIDIIVPGTIIPSWFRHQSKGPSVRIHLPQTWSNNWIGFTFCVAFGVNEEFTDDEDEPENMPAHEIICQLHTNEGPIGNSFGFHMSRNTRFKSDHVWARYVEKVSFRERMVKWNKVSYIEASFGTENECLDVKRCGFRVVSKQDVGEFRNRQLQYIHPPIKDLGADFFWCDA